MADRPRTPVLALAICGIGIAGMARNTLAAVPDGDGTPASAASPVEHAAEANRHHPACEAGIGNDPGPADWHRHRHPFGEPMMRSIMEFHGLDLTPEQRRRMQIIVLSARLQELRQQPAHRTDLSALLDPGDPAYGAAVQAAKQRAAERIQRSSDLRVQLYAVLTPEQRGQLARRVAERRARPAAPDGPEEVTVPPDPAAR